MTKRGKRRKIRERRHSRSDRKSKRMIQERAGNRRQEN